MKLDSDGIYIWARTWGGSSSEVVREVGVDTSFNIYSAGYFFTSTVDFDPGVGVDNHTAVGYDCFLSKLDLNGNFVVAHTWGGTGTDVSYGMGIDSTDNVYVIGYFASTVDFDPSVGVENHSSNGSADIFLSKFDSNADFVWARTWGSTGMEISYSVGFDSNDDVFVVGYFSSTVDFDPGAGVDNHTTNGSTDSFLTKLDSDGNYEWARTWGGSSLDMANCVFVDTSDNIYIGGYFYMTADFDPGLGTDNHTSSGSSDSFLLKLQ